MWNFYNPVAIHAGLDSLVHLPQVLQGRRALLITFKEAEQIGLTARVRALLGDQLVAIESDVLPNPDVRWLATMYERIWSAHPDVECLLALGGGSVIDCAKAILTKTASGGFAEIAAHLRDGVALSGVDAKRLIAIPTTAGTGSEVTPWATIWDTDANKKYSLHQDWTWPEVAIIDPGLMLSLPPAVTLASGLDALSHALESIWNIHRNPVSMSLAASAAHSIIKTLPLLMKEPQQLHLRELMATAALQAGLAFSNTKTALAHALSYDITLHHGVAHGIACSFSLPHVMRLAFAYDPEVDACLLNIFEVNNATDAIIALTTFLENLEVSTNPNAYGIKESWDSMVGDALLGARGRNFISNRVARTA
ncbi:iron-containing alcohol dehydrogenase PsrA [Undibacterium sp. Dicai25W]|uniref:iron-containing alcohol dehydrogenase PsrA n=1 Tax=Undibacterium sp. Dicai25W TaxID=3413034 RepID=UPI003BF040B6